jgi:hypothetical protein
MKAYGISPVEQTANKQEDIDRQPRAEPVASRFVFYKSAFHGTEAVLSRSTITGLSLLAYSVEELVLSEDPWPC